MDKWETLRGLFGRPFYSKDSEKVHLWVHLLLKASRPTREEYFSGKKIICNPGQFTTTRKQIAEETGISESKIERVLNYFEKIEQQIEQQKSNTNRLITITYWSQFEKSEQQSERRSNNGRTTNKGSSARDTLLTRKKNFYDTLIPFMEKYSKDMLRRFFDYWSETNRSKTKMKLELEETWEVGKRLATWAGKEKVNNSSFQQAIHYD